MSMINQHAASFADASRNSKPSYRKPQLTEYGSVAEMTQGGTGGSRCDKDSFISKDKGSGNC